MFGGAGRRSWPTCTQSLRPPGVRPADALAAADAVPAARSPVVASNTPQAKIRLSKGVQKVGRSPPT